MILACMIATLSACEQTNIPFLTAPTSVAATPSGIQNAVTGLFGGTRLDVDNTLLAMAVPYARDGSIFSNSTPEPVQYALGLLFTPADFGGIWAQEYTDIRQAEQILSTIPQVAPPFPSAQAAALVGIVQTIEALNYMIVAEAHDTLGLAILPAGTLTSLAPAVCNKDAWKYVVALLDSANTSLNLAGAIPPPVTLPPGVAGVSLVVGPSTTLGSFASFNRALAAKANLELAYAIARTPTNGPAAPTPATAGVPDAGALATALADLEGSAMWDTTMLAPNTPGGFKADPYTATYDFSASSGDVVNPIQGNIAIIAQLNDFLADVDTANDLRFKAKFIISPYPVQEAQYNVIALETQFDAATGRDTTYSYLYFMSPNPSSLIPITRVEELTLVAAQIELGMGNYAQAIALANQVRTTVGGLPAASVAPTYTTARDFLMKEQRISTTWEASADRAIAIRMYGMAVVSDTTWEHEDPSVTTGDRHTTVNPIPQTELSGRGGSFVPTCQ